MKRRYFTLCLSWFIMLAVCGFAQSQTLSGTSWEVAKSTGTGSLKFAYVEAPSFVYRNSSGDLDGICIEIMEDFVKWVEKNKNIKLSIEYVGTGTNFHSMYGKVKSSSGGVFGLGNITITEERKKEIQFSPPFIVNFAILISNGSLPTLKSFDEISKSFGNGIAYTAKGTENEKRVMELKNQYYSSMKIGYTTTSQEVLDKIINNDNGYGYLDLAFYLEAVKSRKNVKRQAIGDKAAEQFGFIMPKNSDWSSVMEEFFAADGGYMNSVSYRNIVLKHLGETGIKLLRTARS